MADCLSEHDEPEVLAAELGYQYQSVQHEQIAGHLTHFLEEPAVRAEQLAVVVQFLFGVEDIRRVLVAQQAPARFYVADLTQF